jgi:Dyp-type peroxidase family
MVGRLREDCIQGNVIPGFATAHQAVLLVRFPGARAGRRWLDGLRHQVVSSRDVEELRERREARRGRGSPGPRADGVNVALTWTGLECLQASDIDSFPDEFRAGMYGRARQTGDDPQRMAAWEFGGAAAREAHALVLVGADTARDLEAEVGRHEARFVAHGLTALPGSPCRGERLRGPLWKREHFGFRDGISQPKLEGQTRAGSDWPVKGEVVAAGEFILGYPDERGDTAFAGPAWAADGSYLVFRRIRQHVAAFRQAMRREAPRVGLSEAQLAAKVMGRWPSGAKLGDPIERDDPGWNDEAATARLERDDYAGDPDGRRFPLFAHVRKAHPRDLPPGVTPRHRLLRRGIPYGPPLPWSAAEDDGVDRGLLFLTYQASVARQFEHVQRRWVASSHFPSTGDGPDPVASPTPGPHTVSLYGNGGPVTISLEAFVTVTGGGYFFAPSIPALAHLAHPAGDEELAGRGSGSRN